MEISLRPHQIDDVAWLTERGGGILGHGVGAGKTFSAIVAHRKRTSDGRLLVVAPLILLRQWESEIEKVWPGARVVLLHSDERGRERSHAGDRWDGHHEFQRVRHQPDCGSIQRHGKEEHKRHHGDAHDKW